MKDVRCLLGRHANTAQANEGIQPRESEALFTCPGAARPPGSCSGQALLPFRTGPTGILHRREISRACSRSTRAGK